MGVPTKFTVEQLDVMEKVTQTPNYWIHLPTSLNTVFLAVSKCFLEIFLVFLLFRENTSMSSLIPWAPPSTTRHFQFRPYLTVENCSLNAVPIKYKIHTAFIED